MCVFNRTKSQVFKSKFEGWHDVMAADFSRTAESVIRRGVDMKKILQKDQIKTDLMALFIPRQSPMPADEAVSQRITVIDAMFRPPFSLVNLS